MLLRKQLTSLNYLKYHQKIIRSLTNLLKTKHSCRVSHVLGGGGGAKASHYFDLNIDYAIMLLY
jgi:hypothetical protein